MPLLWKSARLFVLGLVLVGLTVPSQAADLDKLAPADAEAVMVINFKNFLDSPLFKKYGADAMKGALKDERVAKLLDSTGLDPMKDLSSLTVTFTGGKADPKVAVIAKGTFQVAKIQTTIEKEAQNAGDKLKITKEGGLTYYAMTSPDGKEFIATFMGNDAIVASNNKDYLKAITDGKKADPTEGSKLVTKTIGKLGGKETFFAVLGVTQEMKDQIGMIPQAGQFKDIAAKLDALSASVNLTEAVDVTVSIHAADMGTAKTLATTLKGLIPLAKLATANIPDENAKAAADTLIQNIKIAADGTAVNARLQLTEELMKKLQPGGN